MKKPYSLSILKLTSSSMITAISAGLLLTGINANAMLPTPTSQVDNSADLQAQTVALTPNSTNVNAIGNPAGISTPAASVGTQTNNNIRSQTIVSTVSQDASGNEVLTPITASTALQSGTVIDYQTRLVNTNSDRLRAMTVTISIPVQVQLIGSVTPSAPLASVDNSNYNQMPLQANINGQIQDMPLHFYKSLRWNIEGLEPNETATVGYRAVVR